MVYSPLAVGLLSGFYKLDAPAARRFAVGETLDGSIQKHDGGHRGKAIATLFEVADELGKTPAQVALAWVLSHPEVTVAITGGDTVAHLEDNIGGVGWTLDAALPRDWTRFQRNLESGR